MSRKIFPEGLPIADDVREAEFRKAVADVKKIQAELVKFIKDPNDGLIVRFYSDPYFWVGVNTKFCDSAAAFRLLFATRYEPAGLFNPNLKDEKGSVVPPEVQTKQWLLKEEESGRIKRLADRALTDTGKEADMFKDKGKFADGNGQTKCPVDSRFFYADAATREQLETVTALDELRVDMHVVERLELVAVFWLTAPAARCQLPQRPRFRRTRPRRRRTA